MNGGDDDEVVMDDLLPGRESEEKNRSTKTGKKRKHESKSSSKHAKSSKKDNEIRRAADVLKDIKSRSVYSSAPLPSSSNLAGKPETFIYSEYKVRKQLTKYVYPYQPSANLTTESFLQFTVSSNKNEWIRFKPDGLSVVIYGTFTNPTFDAGNADDKIKAQFHAMTAREATPKIFIDPTIGLTGFIKNVDVTIDNNVVPTNTTIGNLFLQYVRFSRIFCKKPAPFFARTKQIDFTKVGDAMKPPMIQATDPFDYKTWSNKGTGVRSSLYLDGVFPFSLKNKTLEAIENKKAEHLWFPPNTSVDIKVHMHRTKSEAIFHSGIKSMADYFNRAANVEDATEKPKISISSAALEYEVVELNQEDHVACLKEFSLGRKGYYKYDIPRGQHQALPPNMSFTQNTFQILPFCKLIYVAFLPDWATFCMENTKRPLSGFSKFPENCSKMTVTFASEPLLVQEFENLGNRYTQDEITKKIEYQYKRKLGITTAAFDDFYPRHYDAPAGAGGVGYANESLIQVLTFEISNQVSAKSELLKIECTFGGGQNSPQYQQVVVISVHPNGEATCVQRPGTDLWQWSFSQNA